MGKIAWITGASSGLGWELALQLADQGYELALLARRKDRLDKLATEIRSRYQRKVLVFEADVSQWEAMQAAAKQIEQELGPIDLLFANAGLGTEMPIHRFDPLEARRIFEVNCIGLINSVAAVLPFMMNRGRGQIVGVSSLASYISAPRSSVYCASKAAASSYLEGLRTELRGTALKVTTVCPGFVRTEMTAANKFPMPFLMDADRAVGLILKRVHRGDDMIHFPWQLYSIIRLAKLLPQFLLRLILGAGAKPRKP